MLNELALFAGAGGGILGGHLMGWRTVCAVEREPYARDCLVHRQNDGHLPTFPIWDDVRTFDGRPWRGVVDVVSGGFPCQDISSAGRGAGIDGSRSGLWREMARIIDEVRPSFVFAENSPLLASRGLDIVLRDLAALGYDAEWDTIGAHEVGAPHRRERLWVLAYAVQTRPQERMELEADTVQSSGIKQGPIWREVDACILRVAHGVANRVDRISAIGNGQVPAVAALAFERLRAMAFGS